MTSSHWTDRSGRSDHRWRAREDRFHRHVAERVLPAPVDLAVGVNAHILATTGDGVPTDAASTLRAMAALGVVPSDLADSLRGYSAYVGAVAGWVSDAPDAGLSDLP